MIDQLNDNQKTYLKKLVAGSQLLPAATAGYLKRKKLVQAVAPTNETKPSYVRVELTPYGLNIVEQLQLHGKP